MSVWKEWGNRLLGRPAGFDADLDEEIRFHMETRAAELEGAGLSAREAGLQARREFGSSALVSEESRAAWQFRWVREFGSDLRHAVRAFARTPIFTLTVVISLALGIGATSAIFTALDAALWKPIAVEHPERLVRFAITRRTAAPRPGLPVGFANQLVRSGVFDGLLLCNSDGLSFTLDGRAERVIGESVSASYFETLGVQPYLGQLFTPGVRSGKWNAEAVLSYSFWKRRFGGDPGAIGRSIRINEYPFTIVGVSPPGFFGLDRGTDYELRIPLLPEGGEIQQIAQISGSMDRISDTIARLKPGTNIAAVQTAADASWQQFVRTTPIQRFQAMGVEHLRLSEMALGEDGYTKPFRTPLYVLLGLVAIVLLVACSNAANMLLARASARSRELAVRISIGAGRLRLIRQMLAENLLLFVTGGALGLALASWAAEVLVHFLPQGHIPLALDLHPDGRALLFTFGVALLTGLIFGIAPALEATRGDVTGALKGDSGGQGRDRRSAEIRKLLLASQVALATVLLIAATVFVRTLTDLRPGEYRDSERVLLFTIKPQQENYTEQHRTALITEIARRVSTLPSVQAAGFAENGPLGSRNGSDKLEVPGHDTVHAIRDIAQAGFFDAAGIVRIAGRDFNSGDRAGSPLVAIVNLTLARIFFPNQNPIGRSLRVAEGGYRGNYEIIGVVADTHYSDIHTPPEPFICFSAAQIALYMPTLHVRTRSADTASVIAAVRREFDEVDTGFPVFNIRTMAARVEDSLARERMVAGLAEAFGLLALALAAVGLYGLLAYSVSRRTREIGIRMALGATANSVMWLVMREALSLVVAGGAAGLLMAVAALRMVAHYMESISTMDPMTAAACLAGMVVVAAAAAAAPALRGSRIEPMGALRE
jgi:predicted permease